MSVYYGRFLFRALSNNSITSMMLDFWLSIVMSRKNSFTSLVRLMCYKKI